MAFGVRPASRARRSKRRCCAVVSASCRVIRTVEPTNILSSRARSVVRGLRLVNLGEDHSELAASSASGGIFHDNLNVPAQTGQALNQFAFRDPPELAAEKSGNLGLGQTKNLGGLDLGQALAADDFRDLPNQPRLDQHFLGVRVAEVGVHIAATFVNLDAFNHLRSTFAHLPAPWRAWRPLSTCS